MSSTAVVIKPRAVAAPPKDEDALVHIFCGPCLKRAKEHARKPKPFCGKVMPDRPLGGSRPDLPLCTVCYSMADSAPCSVCGQKALLTQFKK